MPQRTCLVIGIDKQHAPLSMPRYPRAQIERSKTFPLPLQRARSHYDIFAGFPDELLLKKLILNNTKILRHAIIWLPPINEPALDQSGFINETHMAVRVR